MTMMMLKSPNWQILLLAVSTLFSVSQCLFLVESQGRSLNAYPGKCLPMSFTLLIDHEDQKTYPVRDKARSQGVRLLPG